MCAVGHEAEPREILEDRALEFDARALPIVILDAQQHPAATIPRRSPDMQGVDDVAEVQIAGRRRSKPCQHVQSPNAIRTACLAVADRARAGCALDRAIRPLG